MIKEFNTKKAGISSLVLLYNPDQEEQEEYAADLHTNNFDNELYYTDNSIGLNNTAFLSSCFFPNANNIQTYPTMKLVLAITNYKNKMVLNEYINLLVPT